MPASPFALSALLGAAVLVASCAGPEPPPARSPYPGSLGPGPGPAYGTGTMPPSAPPPARAIRPKAARPAPGRPGFVVNPYDSDRVIDVRGVPRGTVIPDPYSGRPVIVP